MACRLGVVQGDHGGLGPLQPGRVQNVHLAGVAEVDRQIETAAAAHTVVVQVQADVGHVGLGQDLRNGLSDPAEAGDDHVVLQILDVLRNVRQAARGRLAPGEVLRQTLPGPGGQRRQHHGHRDHRQSQLAGHHGHDAHHHAAADQHEAELAALGQQGADPRRDLVRQAEGPAETVDQQGLAQHQRENGQRHRRGILPDQSEIDLQPDGHEEEPEQQAAEGPDVGLDLMPVLGARQQQPGQEGAQRHGDAGQHHEIAGAQQNEQGGGDEQLRAAGLGDHAVDRPQQKAAGQQRQAHGGRRLQSRQPQRQQKTGAFGAQERHQGQQGDDRQVLQQQDGEGDTAEAGRQLAPLHQHLQHEGRRGERQAAADHQGGRGRLTQCDQDQGDHRRGAHHLQRAEPENVALQNLQALDRQLQTDGEEQEDDPELGEDQDRLRLFDQAEQRGADHHAGRQVAEHRTRAELARQRHDHHGGEQEIENVVQVAEIVLVHVGSRLRWRQSDSAPEESGTV